MLTHLLGFCFSRTLLRRDISGEEGGVWANCSALGVRCKLCGASEGAYGMGRNMGDRSIA
jgi:hypothetical protein